MSPTDNSANKRIAKNTFFLYIRSIILMLVSLYTSRIVLQVLGVDDYGIYNLVGGVVAMFTMLSSTLSSASQRFITYALGSNDNVNLKNVFSTCVTLHIILGLIVVALLEICGVWFLNNHLNIPENRLSVAHWVFQFSILTFFINVISVPYNAAIIAHEKMSAFAYISIIDGLLKLGIAFLLIWVTIDKLLLFAILHAVVAIAIRILYTFYCTHNFEETNKVTIKVDKTLFKEMFSFSGWNLIGSSSLVLRNQGIDILLNIFFGVSVNAAKGISNQVQFAVHQLIDNFTSAITPQLTKSVAQNDYNRTKTLIFHGTRFSFFMMMVFAIPIMIYSKEILELWLVEVPNFTVEMVNLVLLYLLCDSLSRHLINTLLAFGDIRNYQLIIGGIKMLALPIAYVILKLGGSPLIGIWVNIFLDIVCLGGNFFFIKNKLNISIIDFVIKIVVLPCWITFFIVYALAWLFYRNISNNLFLGCFVSIMITVICIIIALTQSERDLLIKYIKREKRK